MPFGTGEAFLVPEVRELLRRGCELRVVPRSPSREIVHHDAAALGEMCVARRLWAPDVLLAAAAEMLLHPVRALRALGLLFRSRSLVTLGKNLAVFPKGLWLARLARRWRADHIHAHWISTPATMAMIAGTLTGVPWSSTAHRSDIALDNLLGPKMARARFVRFISESGVRMAASLGAVPPEGKAAVIHVGVELPAACGFAMPGCHWHRASAEPCTGKMPVAPMAGPCEAASGQKSLAATVNDSDWNLLCPANLYPVKGHRYLIAAMASLRDRGVRCILHLAGRGELWADLETMVRRFDLADRVRLLGQVPHDEILAAYAEGRYQMVVLPSVDLGNNLHEGIPVCLMEAMAHGIPVVATCTGGIPELLGDGAGIMVPDRDPAALADAMARIITDPALRERLAAEGRRRIEQSFSVETVVAELLARIGSAARPAGAT
jgi:glycosyltransferase involved in cell wall biosynthesis